MIEATRFIRGTIKYFTMVTLDIKNAFNAAIWRSNLKLQTRSNVLRRQRCGLPTGKYFKELKIHRSAQSKLIETNREIFGKT